MVCTTMILETLDIMHLSILSQGTKSVSLNGKSRVQSSAKLPIHEGFQVDHPQQPDQNPAPQNVEINDDLDNLEADQPLVEVETVEEEGVPVLQAPAPVLQAPAPASVDPTEPIREIGLRRYTREKSKPAPEYIPSLSGTKYAYAVTQLDKQGVLKPDAHMFVQEDFYQAEPDVVAIIMTQPSLKAGLKVWGDKAHMAAHSEMKQLHMRNTFKPKH